MLVRFVRVVFVWLVGVDLFFLAWLVAVRRLIIIIAATVAVAVAQAACEAVFGIAYEPAQGIATVVVVVLVDDVLANDHVHTGLLFAQEPLQCMYVVTTSTRSHPVRRAGINRGC